MPFSASLDQLSSFGKQLSTLGNVNIFFFCAFRGQNAILSQLCLRSNNLVHNMKLLRCGMLKWQQKIISDPSLNCLIHQVSKFNQKKQVSLIKCSSVGKIIQLSNSFYHLRARETEKFSHVKVEQRSRSDILFAHKGKWWLC